MSAVSPRPLVAIGALPGRVARLLPAWLALALLGAVNVVLYWPGQMSADAADQLAEVRAGHVSDWHSPWLTLVWRHLLAAYDHHGMLLLLQLLLFWGGACWLSASLQQAGKPRRAWAVLAVCLIPQFWFYNAQVLKDTTFYSAMFLATAAWYAAVLRPGPIRFGRAVLVTAVSLPVRINGAFAVSGLLAVLLHGSRRLRWWSVAALTLVLSALLIVGLRWVNTEFLRTRSSDVVQSLQIHDLMGIQYHSRDETVWGRFGLDNATVDRCYTSFYWDSMSPTGVCSPVRVRLGAAEGRFFSDEAIAARGKLWSTAIARHPAAYLQHRLRHFNSATYFFVPALHVRFNKEVRDGRRPGLSPFTERDVAIDYVKRSVLVWPCVWLAAAVALLMLLWPQATRSADSRFASGLLVSGLAYGLAYFVIGVATDVRYFLWTQLSVALAAVIAAPEVREAWRAARLRRVLGVGLVLAVVVVGFAARILAVPFV